MQRSPVWQCTSEKGRPTPCLCTAGPWETVLPTPLSVHCGTDCPCPPTSLQASSEQGRLHNLVPSPGPGRSARGREKEGSYALWSGQGLTAWGSQRTRTTAPDGASPPDRTCSPAPRGRVRPGTAQPWAQPGAALSCSRTSGACAPSPSICLAAAAVARSETLACSL